MLETKILIFWIVIVNLTALTLFTYAWQKLPRSHPRSFFLIFLLPYTMWANALFVIQLCGAESEYSRLVSQTIFAGGAFFHSILGLLLISISAPTHIKNPLFLTLLSNTLTVGVLAYFGLWENGVVLNSTTGLAPVESKYLWYFNVSLVLWAIYYFTVITITYRKLLSRTILRCQLKILILPAIFSITMVLTTNVFIPSLTGIYSLSAIAGFWLFAFFSAIAYIIKIGKVIMLYEAVKDFERRLAISASSSYDEIGDLVISTIVRSRGIADYYLSRSKSMKVLAQP